MDEKDLYPITDYWYEVTDEQIREHLARPLIVRLEMLDEARQFALAGRRAMMRAERDETKDGQ